MNKLPKILAAAGFLLMSQSALSDAMVNVAHFTPFAMDLAATEVSIRTAGGDVVNDLAGVPYGVDSGFFALPAGNYDLKVANTDGTFNYIDPLPSQNRVVGAWYTYNMEGNPTFLTFDSCDVMHDGMSGETCMNPGGFDGMMATTVLYASSGGGSSEDDMVETVCVGEIDFEILTCLDATATVRLDGADPVTYTASQLLLNKDHHGQSNS